MLKRKEKLDAIETIECSVWLAMWAEGDEPKPFAYGDTEDELWRAMWAQHCENEREDGDPSPAPPMPKGWTPTGDICIARVPMRFAWVNHWDMPPDQSEDGDVIEALDVDSDKRIRVGR